MEFLINYAHEVNENYFYEFIYTCEVNAINVIINW